MLFYLKNYIYGKKGANEKQFFSCLHFGYPVLIKCFGSIQISCGWKFCLSRRNRIKLKYFFFTHPRLSSGLLNGQVEIKYMK